MPVLMASEEGDPVVRGVSDGVPGSAAWADRLRSVRAKTSMVGWDFGQLDGRMSAEEPWCDFEEDCRSAMTTTRRILDLGTGGGERLLRLLQEVDGRSRTVVATEGWEPNLSVARRALADHGVAVLFYHPEHGKALPFPNGCFDLVMCRHEAFDAGEVSRIMTPGGLFLTQQVDGRDVEEIHEWFGVPFLYPDVTASRQVEDLQAAGLHVVTVDQWQGSQTFKDAEALVTYLALCPWDAEGFTVDEHLETLARLDSEAPIHVTQRRFRIHAVKAATQ